jgi:hypothetical protein
MAAAAAFGVGTPLGGDLWQMGGFVVGLEGDVELGKAPVPLGS